MDIISLYYFSEAAKDLHITRTSERLYISQQTLSNHIQRLEEYYDTLLFTRKPKLALTASGEKVLEFAHRVLAEQTNLTDILADMKDEDRGFISFGASSLRMNSCMTVVAPEFYKRFPKVQLRLRDGLSSALIPLVERGDLDLALMTERSQNTDLLYENVMNDRIYMCVPEELLQKYYAKDAEKIKERAIHGIKAYELNKLPFCMLTNQIGKLLETCLRESPVNLNVRMTMTGIQSCVTTALNCQMAFFATQTVLKNRREDFPRDINIFPVIYKEEFLHGEVCLVRSQSRYIPRYTQCFIDMLREYYRETADSDMSRIVKTCGVSGESSDSYIDISHPHEQDMPCDPSLKLPELQFFSRVGRDTGDYVQQHNLEVVQYCPHTGTHMDSPFHVCNEWPTMEEVPVDVLCGPACVLRVGQPGDYEISRQEIEDWEAEYGMIRPGEAVLFDTGHDRYWKDKSLYIDGGYSRLSLAAAEYLVQKKVRFVGMESISVEGAGTDVHRMLMGHGVYIVENLCNLDRIRGNHCQITGTFPAVKGASGAWIRLLARSWN